MNATDRPNPNRAPAPDHRQLPAWALPPRWPARAQQLGLTRGSRLADRRTPARWRLMLARCSERWRAGLSLLALLMALLVGSGLPGVWAASPPGSPELPPAASKKTAATPQTGDSSAGDAGSFQLGKVRILGVPVITVATPTVAGNGQGPDAITRAQVIEGNLTLLYRQHPICSSGESLAETLLEEGFLHGQERACNGDNLGLLGEPQALKVEVQRNGTEPLRLVARVSGRAQPLPLLTITAEDVRLNGIGAEPLAERWRSLLERRLRFSRQLMRPENLQRRLTLALKLELGLTLLVVLVLLLWRRCRHGLLQQEQRVTREPTRMQGLRLQALQTLCRLLIAAVLSLLFSMAGIALFTVPGQVPRALDLLLEPWGIAAKLLIGWVVSRALRALMELLLRQWASNVNVPTQRRARRDQRFESLRRVFRRLIDLLALGLVGLWILGELPGVAELSGSALLASGALIGALALVFQGLLRDFVSGLVLLFDDRYAIGDSVEIQGFSGEVIDVGVLSTELRCLDQRVVVIQNSACDKVVNHTKLRSGVEVQLVLSHAVRHLPQVLELLEAEAARFGSDPFWENMLLEPPKLRGIKAVTPEGIRVSLLLICKAGEQQAAERALLAQLVQRLQEQAIPLADQYSPPVIGLPT